MVARGCTLEEAGGKPSPSGPGSCVHQEQEKAQEVARAVGRTSAPCSHWPGGTWLAFQGLLYLDFCICKVGT